MRTIAVVNQKGGVGKSTTTHNLGAGLALRGRRVLLVDMDPQGNLTEGCGLDPDTLDRSVCDVLIDGAPIKDIIQSVTEGLDLVPANVALSGAEINLLDLDDGAIDKLDRDKAFQLRAHRFLPTIKALQFAPVISGGHNDTVDPERKWTTRSKIDARITSFKKPLFESAFARDLRLEIVPA